MFLLVATDELFSTDPQLTKWLSEILHRFKLPVLTVVWWVGGLKPSVNWVSCICNHVCAKPDLQLVSGWFMLLVQQISWVGEFSENCSGSLELEISSAILLNMDLQEYYKMTGLLSALASGMIQLHIWARHATEQIGEWIIWLDGFKTCWWKNAHGVEKNKFYIILLTIVIMLIHDRSFVGIG